MAEDPSKQPKPSSPDSPLGGPRPLSELVESRPRESIKETIESILIAFILAFVFRAFIVEAFVIPTGSMAPTLLGAHMRLRCAECGYEFPVNYPAMDRGDDNLSIPDATRLIYSMHCPNCGFKVRRESEQDNILPVYYGDRILLLKYLYLIQQPQRWDVVVFKSPSDLPRFTTNYIKRLVGRPGETIMILDGDVYAVPNENAQGRTEDWPWQVQAKPRAVQEALWRVVFDNDYQPANAPWRGSRWTQPWKQTNGSGWNTTAQTGRVFDFENAAGAGLLKFDKDANPGIHPLTDWLPYNETKDARQPDRDHYRVDAYEQELVAHWYVSDLKLQFSYLRQSGDGPMRAILTRLNHAFTAEFTPSVARLIHRLPDGTQEVIGQVALDGADDVLNIEFTNVDYQVTLRINGRDAIRTTPQQYHPDMAQLFNLYRQQASLITQDVTGEKLRQVFGPPRIEIAAERQRCQVSHLSLWRDIYYTPYYYERSYGGWRRLDHGSPDRPIKLARAAGNVENEYFVLGDNSILSADARSWDRPVDLRQAEDLYVESGRVPERFLLGKAFFVYWPAGFRPFSVTAPGVIPNFGQMRFIH